MFIEKVSKIKLNLSEKEKESIKITVNIIKDYCTKVGCSVCPLRNYSNECLNSDIITILEKIAKTDYIQANE